MIHLLLQESEEIFHGRIVGTCPFLGHALEDELLLQHLHPGAVLVMPALVGMDGCPVDRLFLDDGRGLAQRFHDEVEGRPFCHTHPGDFAVIQVHNQTQIKLLFPYAFEFRDV